VTAIEARVCVCVCVVNDAIIGHGLISAERAAMLRRASRRLH